MSSLADIALRVGKSQPQNQKIVDIIEFAEASWGLNLKLYPVQKVILKAHYGLELDDNPYGLDLTQPVPLDHPDYNEITYLGQDGEGEAEVGGSVDPDVGYYKHRIRITDFRRRNERIMTEAEYLRFLYAQGRSNIEEVIPGVERRELVLSIGRRSGKCKSADSLVVTSRGLCELRELGDVNGDEIQPLHVLVSQEKGRLAQSAAFYSNGVRKTRKMVTRAGFTDESTPNHRIKVLDSDGVVRWRYLEDVKVGDHVAINRSTDLGSSEEYPVPYQDVWKLPATVTPDFGLLLGYLVGDGTWGHKSSLGLTGLLEQVEDFESVSEKVLGQRGRKFRDPRTNAWNWKFDGKSTETRGAGRAVREVFHELGFRYDSTVTTKRVPVAIRMSPKPVVAAFLRGLFETDGTVSTSGSVSFCSASFQLVKEVQLLLLNMGILSCIRSKRIARYDRDYYNLNILGSRSRRVFLQEIGFVSDRKQSRLTSAVQRQITRSDNKSSTESIPNQIEWCRRLLESVPKGALGQGWVRSRLRESLGNVIKPSSNEDLSYPRLTKVLEVAKELGADSEIVAHFEHLLEMDYYFDPVVSLEDGECPTFDLNVPDGESFVANGMTNHNTFLCAAVMAYEVYKLIIKNDPQLYYGLPKTNVIQLVSVATDKDQAGLLYNEASGHFSNCPFYRPYTANNTMSYAKFQSPEDINRFGRYSDDPTAKATVKVSFKSCVAKGLRGAGNIVVILDELAHFNDAGQSDALTIYRAVKPSIATFSPKDPVTRKVKYKPDGTAENTEGRILSISSPLGKQGFFYKKFRQGFAGGEESQNMLCIQAPTWEVNPTLSATFLAEEYATDPDSFFTEFGASFSDRTRGWLEPEPLLACIDPNLKPATRAPTRAPHFLGLDISAGLVDGDYCAVAIGHIDPQQRIVLDKIERIRAGEGDYKNLTRLSFDEITAWLSALSKKFYIDKGMFDQWAGIPFETALHKKGLTQCESIFFTKQLSSQIFTNFKSLMYEGKIVLYDVDKTADIGTGELHEPYIAELLELQADVQSKYVINVEAPNIKGKYDDFSDALVRMVWVATQHLGNRKYVSSGSGISPLGGGMSSADIMRARVKARLRSRYGGSSPERQRSVFGRGASRRR